MEQAGNLVKMPPRQASTGTVSSTEEPRCKICNDRGVEILEDTARVCRCMEARRLERLLKTSAITPAFRTKTFGNFRVEGRSEQVVKMFNCAKDFVMKFKALGENNWLVLLGEPGCGKTHLAMAVANNLLSKAIGVLYFQHVEGMSELKSMLRRGSEHESNERLAERMDAMKKVELLIWDDLFKARNKPTEFELERTFEVLNYRYLNLLPTIVTSEKIPEDLYDIDKGICRRIVERGKPHLCIIEGIETNYSLREDD